MVPDDRKYTQEHEWVQVEGDNGIVGITDHAASELGDIVYVDLPDVGAEFSAGDSVGSIESVKAVADLGVDPVGKIENRGAAGEREDIALGGETIHLVRVEVELDRVQELPWRCPFGVVQKASQPGDP